jgi:linoleoyl-CoA desaturase
MKSIKFTEGIGSSEFSKTLSHRVNNYFRQQQVSRYGNVEMVTKTIIGISLWIGTYIWLMSDLLTSTQLIGVYILNGLTQLHMGLNIAHDANHDAYSKNKNVNRILGYVFDLVGLSSYMWRRMHNDSHHYFVNVLNVDSSLGYGGIFRVSPMMELRWYHRFQHIYAPFLYCLASLDWVFVKDYTGLFVRQFGNHKIDKHPPKELIILFLGKAFYYTYTLVLPLIFLSVPWYSILIGFTLMHLCIGFILAVTFQPNHFTETSGFPGLDENCQITNNFIEHIFENTADYARGNPLACWALGGLNLHTVHHMFPKVCHVHYPALTKILRSTAQEYGIPYSENKTISGAFIEHLKWMKILGKYERVLSKST